MATLVLTAAVGSLGLSGFGLFAANLAATAIGSFIDNRLFGPGNQNIQQEGPRLNEISITNSSEGQPIKRLYGRSRIGGNLIWVTNFKETQVTTTQSSGGGGKGGGGGGTTVTTTTYTYSVSFAIAFCEGNARTTLGRIWADGRLLETDTINLEFRPGTQTQAVVDKIRLTEGSDKTPAFRGITYISFEDFELEQFGNRIPQITAEIIKPIGDDTVEIMENLIEAVNLIPSTGEAAYATTPLVKDDGFGNALPENIFLRANETDLELSIDDLKANMPNNRAVNLVVSWFGTDLRLSDCEVQPRVEVQQNKLLQPLPWIVSGLVRSQVNKVSTISVDGENRPAFGGTPSDASISEAIRHLCDVQELDVYFYPFLLMDIPAGNTLPNPLDGGSPGQPIFPWRGRITTSLPSVDKTAAAQTEINSFFGSASASDFNATSSVATSSYTGTFAVDLDGDGAQITFPNGGPPNQPGQNVVITLASMATVSVSIRNAYNEAIDADNFRTIWIVEEDISFSAQTVTIQTDFGVPVVTYTGSASDFGYRRMILHYAHLCVQAAATLANPSRFKGFYVGTEMRGVTRVRRDGVGVYPGVTAFNTLINDVSGIFNAAGRSDVLVSYAADWSEYHSHRPDDGSGDVFFNMDEIWTNPNCDYVAIDNYLPISDWRDGTSHADYGTGNDAFGNPRATVIYDEAYLQGQIEGGEGWDYFYASDADRTSQTRTLITDGALAFNVTTEDADRQLLPNVAFTDVEMGSNRSQNVAWSCRVVLPSSPSDGVLFERGGSGTGIIVCLRDSGTYFRIRAGAGATAVAGGATPGPTNIAVADVLTSTLTQYFDGEVHEVAFDVQVGNPCTVRLWIDGQLVASGASSGAIASWAGTGSGAYLTLGAAMTNIAGEPTAVWPGGTASATNLFMYDQAFSFAALPTPWTFRQKSIREWWENDHVNRPGGNPSLQKTSWTPGEKVVYFSEYGAPAADKSTNQPNVFFDPKSSESFLPYFSNGQRDDQIQRSYYEAVIKYWRDNSPTIGPNTMIETPNMFAWTWDARPYPAFPFREDIWSDGPNWQLGHWLNGRVGVVPLGELVKIICGWVGFTDTDIDVTGLVGTTTNVRGYVVDNVMSPRDALNPLFSAYLFDGFESGGLIKFQLRANTGFIPIDTDELVSQRDNPGGFQISRQQDNELPHSSSLSYVDEETDYQVGTTGTRRQTGASVRDVQIRFPIVLPNEVVRILSEIVIQEAWIGRESIEFDLPPDRIALDPGDGVTMTVGGRTKNFRINSMETGAHLKLQGETVDTSIYDAVVSGAGALQPGGFTAFGVSLLYIMDLPLLTGEEPRPWAARLAAYQNPYPPSVDVFEDTGSDNLLRAQLFARSQVGVLVNPLPRGPHTIIDEGNDILIDINDPSFEPQSSTEDEVRAGANAIAIQTSGGEWEVMKFEVVNTSFVPDQPERRYRLSRLFRGQLGSYAIMEDEIPEGSPVVFLDPLTIGFLDIQEEQKFVEKTYRYASSTFDAANPLFRSQTHTGLATGQVPYPVEHIEFQTDGTDVDITWVRQTRFGGDGIEVADVPLNESSEQYEIDILTLGDVLLSSNSSTTPAFTVTSAPASFKVRIYQISASVGRGRVAEATYGA